MPVSVVKTKKDEKDWKEAKDIVKDQKDKSKLAEKDWPLVMHIFKNKKKTQSILDLSLGESVIAVAAPYFDVMLEHREHGSDNAPHFAVEKNEEVTVIDKHGRKTKMKVDNANNGSGKITLIRLK